MPSAIQFDSDQQTNIRDMLVCKRMSLRAVEVATGISRSTISKNARKGKFGDDVSLLSDNSRRTTPLPAGHPDTWSAIFEHSAGGVPSFGRRVFV